MASLAFAAGCNENRNGNSGAVTTQQETACAPDEVCVTVHAEETTGSTISFILYDTAGADWPGDYSAIPVPDWVLLRTLPLPDAFPILFKASLQETLHAISGVSIDGVTLGLAAFTGVPSARIVYPTDARGFSTKTVQYSAGVPLDFGSVTLAVPQGDTCEINPLNPDCTTDGRFWEVSLIGDIGLVPGAIYMDAGDLDHDGIADLAVVGWPQIENPDAPPSEFKLVIYYLNADLSLREVEVVDQYSATDPLLYSPRGVKILSGPSDLPTIVVGTAAPGRIHPSAHAGVFSYSRQGQNWERQTLLSNADPTTLAYHSALVVGCDLDGDGDDDLALGGTYAGSAVGSWLERPDDPSADWTPHLQRLSPGQYENIRKVMAYDCADMDGDGDNDVIFNAYFDVPGDGSARARGEIWLGRNPLADAGTSGAWVVDVVDADNRNSADMFIHDFDADGRPDILANQILDGTLSLYQAPPAGDAGPWRQRVIATGITSPSDMWLADMNGDGYIDIVTADNVGHAGIWHQHPGSSGEAFGSWKKRRIFDHVGLPGDFVMRDMDGDGDLDWAGTSMTLGVPIIVRQHRPATSIVAELRLPAGSTTRYTRLLAGLYAELPASGPPEAVLAMLDNVDSDHDGNLDVEHIVRAGPTFKLSVADPGVRGTFYLWVALFVEGGGTFQPVPWVDYVGHSDAFEVGKGQATVSVALTR